MDLKAFSSIIETLYAASVEPGGLQRVAPTLARAFRSDSCALLTWDRVSGQPLAWTVTENYTPMLAAEYLDHYRSTDLWLAKAQNAPPGTAVIGPELVADDVLLSSEFYNDYLTRLHAFDVVGGTIRGEGQTEGLVAIHRPHGAIRFNEDDKRFLTAILPHLTQAVLLSFRLAGVYRTGTITTAAVDAMPTGILAVGDDRTLLFANATAELMLSRGTGLTVRHGRVHCTMRDADRRLGPLIQQAAWAALGRVSGAGGVLAAPRAEGRPLSLLVCPMRPELLALSTPRAMALIFVGDPDDQPGTPADMLVKLYGLTPAEARLTQALMAGDTLQEYAEKVGISIHTVKTQLKQVFAKTDTARQTDLVRTLLTNPVLRISVDVMVRRRGQPGHRRA